MSGEDGFTTVRIRNELAQTIDKILRLHDDLGLPLYRSRAEFVTDACKKLLREVLEEEKKG